MAITGTLIMNEEQENPERRNSVHCFIRARSTSSQGIQKLMDQGKGKPSLQRLDEVSKEGMTKSVCLSTTSSDGDF